MTALITQCPHCRTRFRVNGMQLSAARGMVRCGACLEMFDATQHLVPAAPPKPAGPPPAPAKEAAASPPSRPTAPPAKPDTLLIHDDLDLESLELDEELSRLVREELAQAKQRQDAAARPQPSNPPTKVGQKDYDESWAEALLRAEGEAEPRTPRAAEPPPTEPPAPTGKAERREPTLGAPVAPAVEPEPEPIRPMRGLAPARDEPEPLDVEDEPLQLHRAGARRSAWRSLLWGVLILIAALGLVAQYATYHFAELARIDAYRAWFERICPHLGCRVPPLVDIEQIKSSNLVVRSHPEFAGALTVDAILYNRAPFAQPFPLLELRFADINGQLIASRRFKPSEYLAGELAGQALMPPQTPIHIALDILDPGQNAVNYSLSFQSPD